MSPLLQYPVTHADTSFSQWPELAELGRGLRCGAFRMHRVEQPLRTLGPVGAQRLHELCVRSTVLSLGVDLTSYWAARPNYFRDVTDWCVIERDGDLAAWHGSAVWRGDCGTVLYSDMMVTLPPYRGNGLGALLIHDAWVQAAMRTRTRPIVACRTQNPIVVVMLRRFTNETFPLLDGRADEGRRSRAEQAARLVADHKHASAPPNAATFIGERAFPSAFSDAPLPSGDSQVDAYFRTHLDRDRGDAVYAIGFMSSVGVLRGIARYAALRASVGARPRHRQRQVCAPSSESATGG